MKNITLISLVIGTAILVIGCGEQTGMSPNSSDENFVALSKAAVPFKADFQTSFTFLSPPPVVTLEITGSGNETHLGKTTFFSNSTVDGTVVPNIQTGSIDMTGANGDQLIGSFSGTATPPDANGNVTFSGDYTISDGTGRFTGASGSGTYNGDANIFIGTGQLSFIGTVSSPGSLKN